MGRLKGFLSRLEAIFGVLDRSFGDPEPSWTVFGPSWGPLVALWEAWEAAPRRKPSLGKGWPGPCRGTFRLVTPRGRPVHANYNILLTS